MSDRIVLAVLMIAVGLTYIGFAKAFADVESLWMKPYGRDGARLVTTAIGLCIAAAGIYFLCYTILNP